MPMMYATVLAISLSPPYSLDKPIEFKHKTIEINPTITNTITIPGAIFCMKNDMPIMKHDMKMSRLGSSCGLVIADHTAAANF